jgi:hypothetical protein
MDMALSAVKFKFIAVLLLGIEVFWNVMLCHWVSVS